MKYCYDGDQVIAEYNGSDVLQRKYVYGPGIDEPICMIDVSGGNAVYYYHYDGLGSVAALSNMSGDIVERYEYDVFGKCTVHTGAGADGVWMTADDTTGSQSAVGNPYMFTGRRYDAETGLYYYRARYYHPTIGRFLQPDPIRYQDGLNMYTYAWNNPVMYTDPSGTDVFEGWTEEHCHELLRNRLNVLVVRRPHCWTGAAASTGTGFVTCLVACMSTQIIAAPPTAAVTFQICRRVCGVGTLSLNLWVAHWCDRWINEEVRSTQESFRFCMCRARGCNAGQCAREVFGL